MNQKIRVTRRANQFERRKQEHLQAGYRIEDEQPSPSMGSAHLRRYEVSQMTNSGKWSSRLIVTVKIN
jgi:hypothetical protein